MFGIQHRMRFFGHLRVVREPSLYPGFPSAVWPLPGLVPRLWPIAPSCSTMFPIGPSACSTLLRKRHRVPSAAPFPRPNKKSPKQGG